MKNANVLYKMDYYVKDGKCIKAREVDPRYINGTDIEYLKDNYLNIAIQDKTKLAIYCDVNKLEEIVATESSTGRLMTAYRKGDVEFFVKYSNKPEEIEAEDEDDISEELILAALYLYKALGIKL